MLDHLFSLAVRLWVPHGALGVDCGLYCVFPILPNKVGFLSRSLYRLYDFLVHSGLP